TFITCGTSSGWQIIVPSITSNLSIRLLVVCKPNKSDDPAVSFRSISDCSSQSSSIRKNANSDKQYFFANGRYRLVIGRLSNHAFVSVISKYFNGVLIL